MALHIIIDGYNLIRNSEPLSQLDRQDIQLGREALIDMLAAYKKIKPHKITVVFDGAGNTDPNRSRNRIKGILIKFSRTGESADSVITRMAAHEKEGALIVSSDHEIVRAAAACHAATINSETFAERLWLANFASDEREEHIGRSGRRSTSTRKKGPRRRLPKSQRRNKEKIGKL